MIDIYASGPESEVAKNTVFFETEVVAEVLDAALMMRRISISRGGY